MGKHQYMLCMDSILILMFMIMIQFTISVFEEKYVVLLNFYAFYKNHEGL